MSKYKKVILLPDRVTQSVFDLPCVQAVCKNLNKGFYIVLYPHRVDGWDNFAFPGDYLAEDHQGK